MAGGDYRAIAAAGGGIAASGAHIAAATEDEIAHVLNERLRRMAALGVTCVEVKSGYGLTLEGELKQLRAIARVARCGDVPHVVPTYLALHALPRGMDRARYIEAVSTESLDAIAGDRLALFVDAYVDANAFSCAEASGVLERAAGRGLGIRLHIGQFADVGGAEFAARVGAASVDHVEHIDARGIDQLARAGVAVGLLPTASFTLAQAPPPVDAFRRAGISMFVASDANPGTAPTESLPLALAFAVRHYGLTVDEALSGATRNAANALAEHERGRLAKGARADVVLWDLPHEACITQPWGVPKARWVFRDGLVLVAPPPESRG
jgi:imidazolonepropionase